MSVVIHDSTKGEEEGRAKSPFLQRLYALKEEGQNPNDVFPTSPRGNLGTYTYEDILRYYSNKVPEGLDRDTFLIGLINYYTDKGLFKEEERLEKFNNFYIKPLLNDILKKFGETFNWGKAATRILEFLKSIEIKDPDDEGGEGEEFTWNDIKLLFSPDNSNLGNILFSTICNPSVPCKDNIDCMKLEFSGVNGPIIFKVNERQFKEGRQSSVRKDRQVREERMHILDLLKNCNYDELLEPDDDYNDELENQPEFMDLIHGNEVYTKLFEAKKYWELLNKPEIKELMKFYKLRKILGIIDEYQLRPQRIVGLDDEKIEDFFRYLIDSSSYRDIESISKLVKIHPHLILTQLRNILKEEVFEELIKYILKTDFDEYKGILLNVYPGLLDEYLDMGKFFVDTFIETNDTSGLGKFLSKYATGNDFINLWYYVFELLDASKIKELFDDDNNDGEIEEAFAEVIEKLTDEFISGDSKYPDLPAIVNDKLKLILEDLKIADKIIPKIREHTTDIENLNKLYGLSLGEEGPTAPSLRPSGRTGSTYDRERSKSSSKTVNTLEKKYLKITNGILLPADRVIGTKIKEGNVYYLKPGYEFKNFLHAFYDIINLRPQINKNKTIFSSDPYKEFKKDLFKTCSILERLYKEKNDQEFLKELANTFNSRIFLIQSPVGNNALVYGDKLNKYKFYFVRCDNKDKVKHCIDSHWYPLVQMTDDDHEFYTNKVIINEDLFDKVIQNAEIS